MERWKIGLGVIIILAIAVILIIFFRPSGHILVYSVPLCNTLMKRPVETLVKKDFPASWTASFSPKTAEVIVVNDMRCEAEYMANVAIILSDGEKTLFGIFHLHFSRQGVFISAAPILYWKQYTDRNDPKIDAAWKDFIKNVYPMQKKKPDQLGFLKR